MPTIYIHKSGESEINELVSSELLKDFFISSFSVPMFFSPPELSLNFGQRCFTGKKEIFVMMKCVLRLENSSKKRIVFLRYDIGMTSEFLSAKMERVLAGLRVQSYNTKKRIPNFLANLWYFEMSKSAHFPSVYWEKIFFVSQWRTDFKMSFDAKIKFLFGSPLP